MFDILKDYQILAWDVDCTLIDHPKSGSFWQFIELNPYDQQHNIITMRSHGMERDIFSDLEQRGSNLNRLHFENICSIPYRMFERYSTDLIKGNVSENHEYYLYKGMKCSQLGAQVLIDDMENSQLSVRGCELHGISHVHPDYLI